MTIAEYLKDKYGDLDIINFTDKNLTYDFTCNSKNINFMVELKERYLTQKYLDEYDVLIELVQTVPYFKNEIKTMTCYAVNTAVGWFYKCNADRLVFIRYLDNVAYDIIDIDFQLFKNWFLNNATMFKLLYSSKTTGTINAVVPLNLVPKGYFIYKKIK